MNMGDDLQDGMLSHYLREVALSDSTIERRLEEFANDLIPNAETIEAIRAAQRGELYSSTKYLRRLKRLLSDKT